MGLLSLHLIQASLVYINTLMIQRALEDPAWAGRMTSRDLAALSPSRLSTSTGTGVSMIGGGKASPRCGGVGCAQAPKVSPIPIAGVLMEIQAAPLTECFCSYN